jgi:sugar phosphate isomerase/epimerase
VGERRFGLSTHLFHDDRLTRDHLALVAKHGFDAIELFATRPHFDYRDDAAVTSLAGWLAETGLELHSLHAPIAEAVRRGEMVAPYSTASGDEGRRAAAVAEAKAALAVAARIPYRFLRRLPTPRRRSECGSPWKSSRTRSPRPTRSCD